MDQVVEYLPSKIEALSSNTNPSTGGVGMEKALTPKFLCLER